MISKIPQTDPPKSDWRRIILQSSGEDIRACYGCGKCTAGCPMSPFMDLQPHQLVRSLQLADEYSIRRVLNSKTIWCCVSCETCSTRCPQEVRLPSIMDACRAIALETNQVSREAKNIVSFHKAFLDSIRWFGRVPEIFLIMNYKFRSLTPIQDIQLAPLMKIKGKLHLFPKKINGSDEIRKIFMSLGKQNQGKKTR